MTIFCRKRLLKMLEVKICAMYNLFCMNKTYFGIFSIAILIITSAILFISNGQNASSINITPTPSLTEQNNQTPTTDITNSPTGKIDDNIASMSAKTTESGLMVEDLVVGSGEEAISGSTVTVNYVGTLTNHVEFDSSYSRNEPFSFVLGSGEVIQGWDEGVIGMKVGGKRKLTIPPELGYGDRPNGVIPGNSTLIFEIELLSVE